MHVTGRLLDSVLQVKKGLVKDITRSWLLTLIFCKERQMWTEALRVYTGHDKCWATGIDTEVCVCLWSKTRSS